jgi:hypothetical protein
MKVKKDNREDEFTPFDVTLTFESLEEVKVWKAFLGGIGGTFTSTYRGVLNPDLVWDILNEEFPDEGNTFSDYFDGHSNYVEGKKRRAWSD